jgi:hypothetical protein
MDRAGADDDEQAGVLTPQDAAAGLAIFRDFGKNLTAGGKLLLHLAR